MSFSGPFLRYGLWAAYPATALCLSLLVGAAAAGCAKAQARTAEGAPLEMPTPPPRVLAPVEEPPVATVEPVEPAPSPPRASPRPVSRGNGRTEPAQKPEAAAEPPTVQVPVPPAEATPPPEPARLLRAPGGAASEAGIRQRLTVAQRNLRRVDYGKLSADGRAVYDQSKRFAEQAEQALKDQNLVFAATLADKAATLSSELQGR
ncbi:MAG TPA: hypothetical protein VGQ10_11550 [Vicinamibacterales bacterium]|nr:hypothetical protein [Vicinamibacterales bacterium]